MLEPRREEARKIAISSKFIAENSNKIIKLSYLSSLLLVFPSENYYEILDEMDNKI